MIRTQFVRLCVFIIVGCLGSAGPAASEWIVDLYGGGGFVDNTDVSITRDTSSEGISTTSIDALLKNVDLDNMLTGGLRLGYWFETRDALLGFDVGLSVDMFYFPLRIPSQTIQADSNVAIEVTIEGERIRVEAGEDQSIDLPKIDTADSAIVAPEFMVRRPLLISSAFPHGRIQPYVTIAPGLLFTDTDPVVEVGIKAGAGLVWQLHRYVALMAEYRFTHFEFRTDNANLNVEGVTIRSPEIEADLTTHFVVAGLALRF